MRGLWQLDQDVFLAVQRFRTSWLDGIFIPITSTGLGWVQVLLILGIFANHRQVLAPRRFLGLAGPTPRSRLVLPLLIAYATSGIVNQVVKRLVERERPSNLDGVDALEKIFFNSYVSGHTTTSFAIGATLAWLTAGSSQRGWGHAAIAWACLVGFSRIYVGVHWPTDVLGGAAIGVLVGTWVAWLYERPSPADDVASDPQAAG